MELQAKIDGYAVELDIDVDGSGISGCWIHRKENGRRYTGSLQYLESQGYLTADVEETDTIPVPEKTITRITDWAERHGY